jgi:hypothetical protein
MRLSSKLPALKTLVVHGLEYLGAPNEISLGLLAHHTAEEVRDVETPSRYREACDKFDNDRSAVVP